MSKEFVFGREDAWQGWAGVAGHIVSFVWKQSEMTSIVHLPFCPGTHEIGPQPNLEALYRHAQLNIKPYHGREMPVSLFPFV